VNKIKIAEDVVFRELSGELVILSLSSGEYFGLDAIGTKVWKLLLDGSSVEKVVDTLVLEFDIDRETLRSDVDALVKQLVDRGLIDADG
jgi:hypothetical protein